MALKVTSLIDGDIYGYYRQLTHMADSEKQLEELGDEFSNNYASDRFPYLNEATSMLMEHGFDSDTDFLIGLNVILNGISLELQPIIQ